MSLDNILLSLIVNAVSFNANLTLTPLVPSCVVLHGTQNFLLQTHRSQTNISENLWCLRHSHHTIATIFVSENTQRHGIVQMFSIWLLPLTVGKGYDKTCRPQ